MNNCQIIHYSLVINFQICSNKIQIDCERVLFHKFYLQI